MAANKAACSLKPCAEGSCNNGRQDDDAKSAPMTQATEVLVYNVVVPTGGLQARKKLEHALLEWLDGAEQRLRFVLCGGGGAGKSTLAVKFAAAQAERGGSGARRRVLVLGAPSMEADYTGLFGQAPVLCAAAEFCYDSRLQGSTDTDTHAH